MFQAGEQHEQSPAGTRSRRWRWSWEPELKLSICPSAADALRLPRQRAARGYLQCHFTTQQSLNIGAPRSLFVECVEGRKFGAGVSQPSH